MEVTDIIRPDQDPAGKMAEFLADLRYEQIPEEHVEFVKKDLLDALACLLAGSIGPTVEDARALTRELGEGRGKGRVLVFGDEAPVTLAAFTNGTMARAQDMGDTHNTGGHITEWIVPTILTALTADDTKYSGKDFITAFVGGAEWGAREHVCIHLQFHTTTTPGECAGSRYATGALAKLRGLNRDQIWAAQGMAYCMHPQHEQQKYNEGTPMARVQHGWISGDAIEACFMAKRNVETIKGIYMGESGLLKTIWHKDTESPDFLTADLGKRWIWREGVTLKPYGGCKYNHTPIYALLTLMKEHGFTWQEIEGIHYVVSYGCRNTIEPHEGKWNPKVPAEAMFSTPYAVAYAAMTGDCFIDAFWQENIDKSMSNPYFVDLMNRMTFEVDPSIKTPFDNYTITVTLKDGRKFSKVEDMLPGNTKNPMSWADVERKFWRSAQYAAVDLGKEKYEKLIDLCKHLEQVEDIHELVQAMLP